MNLLSAFEHALLTPQNLLEAVSAVLGLCGAYLLAVKSPWASWAFVLWLFSNLGWIAFGWVNGHWFLVAQNLAFAVTSVIGIWTWRVLDGRSQAGCAQVRRVSESPPEHVAQDSLHAENYRLIRRGQHWSVVDGVGNFLRGDDLDAAVNAAKASGEKGGV